MENPLGKKVLIPKEYKPELLYAIPRSSSRLKLSNFTEGKSYGFDLWRVYEISWLGQDNKPEVRIGEFIFHLNSTNIIESKSLKLYLSSLNNEVFKNEIEYKDRLTHDFSSAAGMAVEVTLHPLTSAHCLASKIKHGRSLDEGVSFQTKSKPDGGILQISDEIVQEEQLYSELFRSLCPITGQPDWATFLINYSGPKINECSLLAYICSFRNHAGYHEDCGERIFQELLEYCNPTSLTISLKFLRRGGIDINVHRSTANFITNRFLPRLVRQ